MTSDRGGRSAWLLAALLAAVVLLSPRWGGSHRWILESKWALLAASAGAAAAFSLALGHRGWTPDTPSAWAAWLLVAAHALSTLVHGAGEAAAFRTAQLAALALVLAWSSRCLGQASRLLAVLSGLGALTGILVIVQRAGHDPFGLLADAHGPGAATFNHKGLAAAFLSIALGPALAAALRAKGAWAPAAWLALLCQAAALAWCDTRAAWIGAALALLVFLGALLCRRAVSPKAVSVVLIVLGISAALGLATLSRTQGLADNLAHNLTQRVRGIFSASDSNRRLRTAFWKVSMEAWTEHPWLGHGPGAFDEAVKPAAARDLRPEIWDGLSSFAHNDVIQVGVETGWLGAGALLLLIGALALAWVGVLRRKESEELFWTRAAAAAGLAAGAVNVLLAFPLFEPACALALAVLAGLLTGSGSGEAGGVSVRRPGLALAVGLLTLVSSREPAALGLVCAGRPAPASLLAPGMEAVRMSLYEGALARGDEAEASRQLQSARRSHPADSQVWEGLGELRLARHDLEGAQRLMSRAVALAPWNAFARMNLAIVRFRKGDPAGAYRDLETCLRDLPDFAPPIHGTWGRLMTLEGRDPIGAMNHLDRSLGYASLPPTVAQRAETEAWIARCRRQMAERR